MGIAFGLRLMAGFAFGFEVSPLDGVYLQLYIGILEVTFFDPELVED
jgi:hypothetical protein